MKTVKLTYEVIWENNPFAQKTVSSTVSNNNNAFSEFEENVRKKFEGEEIDFNHAGKVVTVK